jgi:hypothetical protein
VTSSNPMSDVGIGLRRRPSAEAPRSESMRVRLSPVEAAVVGDAAARAGMSVGAWVGHTAVDQASVQSARDDADEAGGVGKAEPSSWRELVAALVALRAEVVAARRMLVVEPDPAAPGGEPLDGQTSYGTSDPGGRGDVVELLRRIDAVTAAVVEAMSSSARRSSPAGRSGQS